MLWPAVVRPDLEEVATGVLQWVSTSTSGQPAAYGYRPLNHENLTVFSRFPDLTYRVMRFSSPAAQNTHRLATSANMSAIVGMISAPGKMNTLRHDTDRALHETFEDFELINKEEAAEGSDDEFEIVEPYSEQGATPVGRPQADIVNSPSSSIEAQPSSSIRQDRRIHGKHPAVVAAPASLEAEPVSPTTSPRTCPEIPVGFASVESSPLPSPVTKLPLSHQARPALDNVEAMLQRMRIDSSRHSGSPPAREQPYLSSEPLDSRHVVENARLLQQRARLMSQQAAKWRREMVGEQALWRAQASDEEYNNREEDEDDDGCPGPSSSPMKSLWNYRESRRR